MAMLPPGRRFARALDIGFGVGAMSVALTRVADQVLGLDIAQSAVDRAALLARSRLERVARTWSSLQAWSLAGLHGTLMRRQADAPAILRALGLHSLSWALGSAEVWLALWALGHAVSARDSFVIESLAMAARSAGFAVPGAVGVQEGGFVLVCGLFGVPADMALALSVLKRLREILVGVPALLARQT